MDIQPDTKRFKRRLKLRQKQALAMTSQANKTLNKGIDKHIIKKIEASTEKPISWRFIASWLLLLVVLVGGVAIQAHALGRYYLGPQPVPGGEYVEGVEGSFSNASPLFATSNVDISVSKLLFSGLLKYDEQGELVGDLAESWTVNDIGNVYTIKLRPNLHWHDGEDITSADIVYTIQAIQNPDTKSPYNLSWQGVTPTAPDARTVVLTLTNPLASFVHGLTLGIVPQHVLGGVPNAQLRSNEFSSRLPIGSGPFVWGGVLNLDTRGGIQRQRIAFQAFDDYHLGEVKLARYTIETFPSQEETIRALRSGQIHAATLVSVDDMADADFKNLAIRNIPIMSGVYLFFNNSRSPLNEKVVRQGVIRSVDTKSLRAQLGYPVVAVDEPFLRGHIAYDAAKRQAGFNAVEAAQLLDSAGWVKGANSFVRQKDGKALEFTLLTEVRTDYARLADALQRQLVEVGVKLNVQVLSGREFQQALLAHNYDALLYGISIGEDPDVFAYWHSSQAALERFNFSEYKSAVADEALSSGRTRSDDALRRIKYSPLLDAWRDEAPAIGLYQPRLVFLTHGRLYNMDVRRATVSADRYSNVHNWMYITEEQPLVNRGEIE